MSMEEKLGILRQLYKMTQADNEVKPVEYSFLYEVALSMEVPLEQLEEIFDYETQFKLPKDLQNKIIQIYRLALIMKVDKDIAKEELDTLKSIALQMGLHPEAVHNMLDKMNTNETGTLDYNELMQIFKTHDN